MNSSTVKKAIEAYRDYLEREEKYATNMAEAVQAHGDRYAFDKMFAEVEKELLLEENPDALDVRLPGQ